MEILTGEQMRRVDRRAIEGMGIPSLDLMESAGRGVVDALLEDYPDARKRRVVVLCGKGNNGGDGLVAARHLLQRGLAPEVILLAKAKQLKGDAAVNFRSAREAGVSVREVDDERRWSEASSLLDDSPIVIDAMLGTGVSGGARGLIAQVIDRLNQAAARVVSVDLPSGIDADSTEVHGSAVSAERTYTLCRPKLALVLGDAAARAGRWRVVPIGIPDEAVGAVGSELDWFDAAAARDLLPRRPAASHKGSYGHLLALAGSRGKSGAAVLLARGALRCGVGLVTVAAPASAQRPIAVQQAEVMTEALPETSAGGLARGAVAPALELASGRDALALGPGLGTEEETREFVREVYSGSSVPLVLDADGLNAMRSAASGEVGDRGATPTVLTPHPGEAARLLGCETADVQADRLESARRLARSTGAVAVLKGYRSLVATPQGRVSVNSTGNPGMATAGTGDVLTGALGAFLARGMSGWDAARLAVFVHGQAGDRAACEQGQEGMIASDLIGQLPRVLAAIGRENNTSRR